MRRAVGLLLLIALISLGVLEWARTDSAPQPLIPDRPELERPASAIAEAVPDAAANNVSAARQQRHDVGPTTVDVPGTRVEGRLRLADAVLAGAKIEAWKRPYRGAPTRVAESESDAEGRFVIDGLTAERHVLAVVDERAPIATVVSEGGFSGDGVVDLGERVIAAPGTITATVVDAGGAPLAGVVVVLEHGEWSSGFGPEVALGLAGGEPGAWPRRATDADGVVRFERMPPGHVTLTFDAPEFVPNTRWGTVVAGAGLALGQVALARGRRIDGRVLDWTGQPVAGAKVEVATHDFGASRSPRGATTDAGGRFVLTGTANGTAPTLRIEAAGQVPIEPSDYATSGVAEIRLPRPFWITGKVAGAPADAVHVRVDQANGRDSAIPFASRYHLMRTPFAVATDGGFRVGPLLPGRWKVWADAGARGASGASEVVVVDADVVLDIEVPKRSGVMVIARAASGEPARDALIAWEDGEDITFPSVYRKLDLNQTRLLLAGAERGGKHARTDAEGRALLPIDVERPFAIAIDAQGTIPQAKGFVDGERPEQVEFVLAATGSIRGRLRGYADSPVSGWSVNATRVAPDANAAASAGSAVVGADGEFTVSGLLAGRYRLGLYIGEPLFDQDATVRPGDRTARLGAGAMPADAPEVEVSVDGVAEQDIELPAVGSVHGIVATRGNAIGGCQVFAMALDDRGTMQARFSEFAPDDDQPPIGAPVAISGPRGDYRFHVLRPGRWNLFVRHPKGHLSSGPWPVEITQPGQEVVRDLQLGGARITVSIAPAWLATWPARGARRAYLFRAASAGDDAFESGHHQLPASANLTPAEFDAEGRAELEFVPAGSYVLRVVAGGDVIHQQGVVVAGDHDIAIGPLAAPVRVPVALAVRAPELPPSERPAQEGLGEHRYVGVVVRALLDGIDAPAYFARAKLGADGRVELAGVPPGRYEVRTEAVTSSYFGNTRAALGRPAVIEVGADGAVRPSEVDLR